MIVHQFYRFALDPTPAQARALSAHCGAARFAFSRGPALVTPACSEESRSSGLDGLARALTDWAASRDGSVDLGITHLAVPSRQRHGVTDATGGPHGRTIHHRVADLRRDGLPKPTSTSTAEFGSIVAEGLNVAGMLRDRRPARSVADAGLAEIRRQLAYKTRWRGSRVIVADRWFPSSRTCVLLERTWSRPQAHRMGRWM